MLKDLLCHQNANLEALLDIINKNSKGLVFVVDDSGVFKGTVTDGDIRRFLMTGCDFSVKAMDLVDRESEVWRKILLKFQSTNIGARLKHKSVTAHVNTKIQDLMKKVDDQIRIIPLLDDDGRVVNFFEYQAKFNLPVASPNLGGNELAYVMECLETNWISSQGRFVTAFENQFAELMGTKHALAVSNGTVAIHLSLIALGIGPGDEVIVPDLTFAATINPVISAGATPVIVDIEREGWCIDPGKVEEAITEKTRAIIPVHIYGQAADMKALKSIAEKHGLHLIEDAAEAHCAKCDDQMAGAMGTIGCFSFFANKIITCGEGGMCVLNDSALYEKMKTLRDHGMDKNKKYWHTEVGFNYRLTNMQAAVGLAQLENIEDILAKRHWIQSLYDHHLLPTKMFMGQADLKTRTKVTWLVSYLLDTDVINRDELINKCKEKGIDVRPFFYPLSDMPIYKQYIRRQTPASREISRRGVNLPTLLSKSKSEYEYTIEQLNSITAQLAAAKQKVGI